MMTYHIIHNPFAKRGGSKLSLSAFIEILEARGLRYVLHTTEGPRHATRLVAELCENADDNSIIVIIGGDGTVFECINGDKGRGVANFGLIPGGTGNDVARVLNIPENTAQAAEKLLSGQLRPIDTIHIKDAGLSATLFISYGIAAQMVLAMLDFKTRNKLSYMKSLLQGIFTYKAKAYEVIVDGESRKVLADFCSVHNSTYAGGGMHLVEGAEMDDGLLELLIVEHRGKGRRMLNLLSILRKVLYKQPNVTISRVKQVTIISPDDKLCCLDGEIVHLNKLEIEVLHHSTKFMR